MQKNYKKQQNKTNKQKKAGYVFLILLSFYVYITVRNQIRKTIFTPEFIYSSSPSTQLRCRRTIHNFALNIPFSVSIVQYIIDL